MQNRPGQITAGAVDFLWEMWREAPSAPPLGELLSVSEAEGVRYKI